MTEMNNLAIPDSVLDMVKHELDANAEQYQEYTAWCKAYEERMAWYDAHKF